MNQKVNYTQVVWEITRLLQESESLEEALRVSLGMVVKAVDAEAGTIWFYNKNGDLMKKERLNIIYEDKELLVVDKKSGFNVLKCIKY